MTKLHAGGKFGGGSYAATGGLHGVGASVVNALASRLDVEVDRDGKIYWMSFKRGGGCDVGGRGGMGGSGGGGNAARPRLGSTSTNATAGTANTGGGGGGSTNSGTGDYYEGKAGGSGIVIIRYAV